MTECVSLPCPPSRSLAHQAFIFRCSSCSHPRKRVCWQQPPCPVQCEVPFPYSSPLLHPLLPSPTITKTWRSKVTFSTRDNQEQDVAQSPQPLLVDLGGRAVCFPSVPIGAILFLHGHVLSVLAALFFLLLPSLYSKPVPPLSLPKVPLA